MKTILIVDDARDTSEVLTLILEMSGYRVVCAANGVEGLEKVNETKPDLIMLDYMMPFMNGAAMCEVLRAQQATSGIKIVVHTCLAESAVKARFKSYDAFLRKPFEADGALLAIHELLQD